MHGRAKKDVVQPTAEEKEKQREQVRTARALFGKLLGLRSEKAYNQTSLEMTSKALQFHPEFPTLWGYRRELLLSGQVQGEFVALLEMEMKLLEKALRKSQKVYSIWFHRRWTVDRLFEVSKGTADIAEAKKLLDTELDLCNRLLEVDERNFHCWNHRAHVVKLMRTVLEAKAANPEAPPAVSATVDREEAEEVSPEAKTGPAEADSPPVVQVDLAAIDLALSTKLINQNFSNYSAWHLRALLQTPSATTQALVDIDLTKELEWVQQGIYTEPNDQSIWLYHQWLTILKKGSEQPFITQVASLGPDIFIFFSRPVFVQDAARVTVKATSPSGDGRELLGRLALLSAGQSTQSKTRPLPETRRRWSPIWRFKAEEDPGLLEPYLKKAGVVVEVQTLAVLPNRLDETLRLTFKGSLLQCDADEGAFASTAIAATQRRLPSKETQDVLKTELERAKELLELEPECRWAMLAIGHLAIAAAEGASAEEQIAAEETMTNALGQAAQLDPLRVRFYAEASAASALRLATLRWLSAKAGPSSPLDLQSLGLRCIAPTALLTAFGVRRLCLDGNDLEDLGPVLQLLSLEELSAARNKIRGSLTGALALPRLRRLDLAANLLRLPGPEEQKVCPRQLEHLDVSGNAVLVEAAKTDPQAFLTRMGLSASWTVNLENARGCICKPGTGA